MTTLCLQCCDDCGQWSPVTPAELQWSVSAHVSRHEEWAATQILQHCITTCSQSSAGACTVIISHHLSSAPAAHSAQWNYLTTTSDQQVFTMNQLQAVVTSFLWCATKLTSAQFGQPTNANPFVDQVNIVEMLLKMFKYFCCHLHHSFIHWCEQDQFEDLIWWVWHVIS